MKTVLQTTIAAAVLVASSFAANAQVQSAEAGFAPDIYNAQSTLTRQQVNADYQAALKDGSLPVGDGDSFSFPAANAKGATLARSEVQRQATAAAHAGNGLQGEGSVQ